MPLALLAKGSAQSQMIIYKNDPEVAKKMQ